MSKYKYVDRISSDPDSPFYYGEKNDTAKIYRDGVRDEQLIYVEVNTTNDTAIIYVKYGNDRFARKGEELLTALITGNFRIMIHE